MSENITIPYETPLDGKVRLEDGPWGVILTHGERSDIDNGFLPILTKKLAEKNISSVLFNFPFRQNNERKPKNLQELDEVYTEVWNWVNNTYEDIRWALGGHGLGAEIAIRVSGLVMTKDNEIPPIISLSYPLYPPDRPERLQAGSLGAIMGEALFCQPENSNRGTFDRLKNQVDMMMPHASLNKIKGANHNMEIPDKSLDRVAFWISNDVERFLKNIF